MAEVVFGALVGSGWFCFQDVEYVSTRFKLTHIQRRLRPFVDDGNATNSFDPSPPPFHLFPKRRRCTGLKEKATVVCKVCTAIGNIPKPKGLLHSTIRQPHNINRLIRRKTIALHHFLLIKHPPSISFRDAGGARTALKEYRATMA